MNAKSVFTWVGLTLLGLLLLTVLTALLTGANLAMFSFFAPRRAAVERRVFETTKSFEVGQIQELNDMRIQYLTTTDPEAKAALASAIRHRAANINRERLPVDLNQFIVSLR